LTFWSGAQVTPLQKKHSACSGQPLVVASHFITGDSASGFLGDR